MAYNTEELEKMALAAIKEHGLIFIEEVVSFLPCSKPTFYEHGLNESNAIKKAILKVKLAGKAELRKKWAEQRNATTELALYKLYANEDEFNRLSLNKNEHTGKDGAPLDIKIQVLGNDAPITDEPDYDDD